MTLEEEARVCAAARSYLGTPWLGQGRTHAGIDCTGLPVVSFRDAGFEVDEGPVDYRGLDSARMMRTLMRHCVRVADGDELRPADIVLYQIPALGHVALLVDGSNGLNMIHVPQGSGAVETRFDTKRGKIKGIYRWRQSSSLSR